MSQPCPEHREGKSLCIEDLNNDVQRDSKLTYSGTERHTVAEKMDATRIVHVHSVIILRHSVKTKGRVEISPEQLSAASFERSAEETGHPLRVVVWYHPRPHVTVWSSHTYVHTKPCTR